MAEIARSYLIIVGLPGLFMFSALRLAGVGWARCFMWGCVAMAATAVLLFIIEAPWRAW